MQRAAGHVPRVPRASLALRLLEELDPALAKETTSGRASDLAVPEPGRVTGSRGCRCSCRVLHSDEIPIDAELVRALVRRAIQDSSQGAVTQ